MALSVSSKPVGSTNGVGLGWDYMFARPMADEGDVVGKPVWQQFIKEIVHFKINFWYVVSYLKAIQDVGVFVSTVFSILIFFGQTVFVFQSYNAGLGGPPSVHLKEHAQRSQN